MGNLIRVLFPRQREAYRARILKGNIVVVTGKAETNDFGTQIIVSDISTPQVLSNNETPLAGKLVSPFSGIGEERPRSVQLFKQFKAVVDSYDGVGDMEAIFEVDGKEIEMGVISSDVSTVMMLKRQFGGDKIVFKY